MPAIDTPRRYDRKRFIATHLAVVAVFGIWGGMSLNPVALIAILAPLAFLRGARRYDVGTIMLSIALAVLLLACLVGGGLLIFALALGSGSWR